MEFARFDSHCHLYFPQFDQDREAVLARMEAERTGAVVIGTDLSTSRAALALAKERPFLWAAVGLHPNDNPAEQFDADAFEALARDERVVAIGECGLDYFRSGGTPEEKMAQMARFEAHVALAERVGKTLVIHCRNAHEDMLEALARLKPTVPVVIHFFTGSAELAERYLALGCYLSFPGPITYTDMYDASIKACPTDRLLTETDAPFAAPVPFRGKRNEPAYVEHVAAKIAALKGESLEAVLTAASRNAVAAFRLV